MTWTLGMAWKMIPLLLLPVYLCVAERHIVYWNQSNSALLQEDYTLDVRLNDHLDILCPHYPPSVLAHPTPPEEYTLYLVGSEEANHCRVGARDPVRWECRRPHAPHGPETFSEKIQRFTPFSLGKEFREGQVYHYISKSVHRRHDPCLRLRVFVKTSNGAENHIEHQTIAAKPVADQPARELPNTQKSTGASSALAPSLGVALLLLLLPLVMS